MELKDYLSKHLEKSTVKRYLYDIENYLKFNPNAKNFNYQDVLFFISELQKSGLEARAVSRYLMSIKKYYDYLLHSDYRQDHPCKEMNLKNAKNKPIHLQDLFTVKELESLLNRRDRYEHQVIRNKLIVSFLIYQGLTNGEVQNLKWWHIDFESGRIRIPSSTRLNARELPLKAKQIHYLHRSANEKEKSSEKKEKVFNINQDTIKIITKHYREWFKERIVTSINIRQSVIANWLKSGLDLRTVQYMAGHKYVSTTEKYEQSKVEELQQQIEKFHPLK